ncbi:MAG: hypothetical protein KBE91_06805 [Bacteroidia bacterium]|nr:hypothetical protein [Bacteroidia bacterium]
MNNESLKLVFEIVQIIALVTGGIFAYNQFKKQQKFKRIQNISSLWKEFSNNDANMEIFEMMDSIESDEKEYWVGLEKYDRRYKLKYLALLEEVALYINAFEIDSDDAKYLFQWHFYFVFLSEKTTTPFWANLGGRAEMNADYWKRSRELAKRFKPKM